MTKKIPNCPSCGNKMIEIIYGMYGPELYKEALKGKVFLGGCCIIEGENPDYHCNTCRRSYFVNLKDYIEEPNMFDKEEDDF